MSQRLNEHNVLAAQLRDALRWAEGAHGVACTAKTIDDATIELVRQAQFPLEEALRAVERVVQHEWDRDNRAPQTST